jgi:hypothetical protein
MLLRRRTVLHSWPRRNKCVCVFEHCMWSCLCVAVSVSVSMSASCVGVCGCVCRVCICLCLCLCLCLSLCLCQCLWLWLCLCLCLCLSAVVVVSVCVCHLYLVCGDCVLPPCSSIVYMRAHVIHMHVRNVRVHTWALTGKGKGFTSA